MNPAVAVDFLRRVAPPRGCYLNLVAIEPDGPTRAQSFDAESIGDAGAFIERYSDRNLYFGVNPLARPLDKKAAKTDVVALAWLHVDVDDPSDDALARIRAVTPAPTCIIFSGGGWQGFWQLAEPVRVNGNITELESYNQRLDALLGADDCFNIDRLMRLPGTTNFPNAKKRAKGRTPTETRLVEFHEERRYSLDDFSGLPPLERRQGRRVDDGIGEDRSADLMRRVARDVRRGLAGYEIVALHSNHPHARDQADPERAVHRCIEKARLQAESTGAKSAKSADSHEWLPPTVVRYGASFDAARIPRRQWILGNRYANAEVTAYGGPPGTNKSSLMQLDAVQLVTGRSLFDETVHVEGGVLCLIGEDGRRDFEARLAGICVFYGIAPADLADKLHVVYLGEIDANTYSLAEMVADVALLNHQMLQWLRDYPDVIAVFIDPMLAWHRLIENDNTAMQILCSSLRALAVQGRKAVAFDHHVTKLSMVDPEAHVGNLASLRGGSSIAADARWAFTLAKLRRETAEQFGIAEEMRSKYRRLDPLKASYGPDDGDARLLRIESVQIANGETVGVLVEVDADTLRADSAERRQVVERQQRALLADALARMLRERCPRSASDAATWLATREPTLFTDKKGEPAADRTIRRKLPAAIGAGVAVQVNGKPNRVVITESGSGTGTRQVITFEQQSIS